MPSFNQIAPPLNLQFADCSDCSLSGFLHSQPGLQQHCSAAAGSHDVGWISSDLDLPRRQEFYHNMGIENQHNGKENKGVTLDCITHVFNNTARYLHHTMTVAGLAAVVTVVRGPAVLYSVTRRLARVTALCCGVWRLMRDSWDRVT